MSGRWVVDEPAAEDWLRVRIVLVRHGESQWNAEGRIQGQLCSGLSGRGHAQARDAAVHLHLTYPDAALVVGSDLERVVQTAAPYAAITGHAVHPEKRLREIDNGVWSGQTSADVAARYPDEIAAIRRGEDIPRGGGETFAQMRTRVAAALLDIARRAARHVEALQTTVVVFTHGGPIRVAVAEALGLPAGGHRLLDTADNCSITELAMLLGTDGALLSARLASYSRLPASGRSAPPPGDDAVAESVAPA